MTPPTGRPSGTSDSRERILASARKLFAAKGFQQTSLRSIAADAGVDVALISHYFDHKRGLFLAVADIPIDPAQVVSRLHDVPIEHMGSALLRQVLTIWSSPAGPGLIAVFRSSLGGEPEIVRDLVTNLVAPALRARLLDSVSDVDQRLPLAATQITGVMVVRHILQIEPVASMSIDQVVKAVGPNVDRLLTGDLE